MSNTIKKIGIYEDIHESGNKTKDRHKLYYATCSVCGTVVEKRLADIKESNKVCRHKVTDSSLDEYKINDMPKGWMNQSELNMRIYYLWKAMLVRTTKKFWKKYPTYEGTTVDDSWRKLSAFVNDIRYLSGYDEWVCSPRKMMMLDKDTLVKGNKHYSKEMCCFITHAESNRDVANRHPESLKKARKVFIQRSSEPVKLINKKSGEIVYFSSMNEACRKKNLNHRNAWMALSDKYPNCHSVKDWFIEYANDESEAS